MEPRDLYLRSICKKPEIHGLNSYVAHLPLVQRLDTLEFHQPVTFLVGENGSGKSTLLEAIAVAWGFNPEGGSRNFNFSTQQTHSPLAQYLKLVRGPYRAKDGFFLRAESFYNVATEIDRLDTDGTLVRSYGGISLHGQSHGESFLSLMLHRFGGQGLYLLDEPESALSPTRQLAALSVIHQLVQQDSQFIIATHSPILMAYPQAEILVLDEEGPHVTPYRQPEHYQLTRRFLEAPEKMLAILLEED